MGRLPAGVKPEPLKDRLARYRADLEQRGGRRVIVDLEPEAAEALESIMDRDGLQNRRDKIKHAISSALIHFATLRRPRG